MGSDSVDSNDDFDDNKIMEHVFMLLTVAAKSPSRKISHGICKTKTDQKPRPGFSRPRGTPTLKSVCVEVLGNSFLRIGAMARVLAYLLICLLSPREEDSIILL